MKRKPEKERIEIRLGFLQKKLVSAERKKNEYERLVKKAELDIANINEKIVYVKGLQANLLPKK